jgi:hypothetical protein
LIRAELTGMAGGGQQFMARKSDPLSGNFGTDEDDGWLGGIVADEDELDRHTLWRLGLWGFAAVGALTLGLMSGQFPLIAQHSQVAASEVAGQTRKVEAAIQENRLEARRLAAAVDTLNGDRDRLFSRLSSIEQGLDVVTGSLSSIKKADDGKSAATPWPEATQAPIAAPIASMPATIVTQAAPAPAAAPPPAAVAEAPAPEPEPPPVIVAARSGPADDPPPPAIQAAAPSVIQAMPIPAPQPAALEADAPPAQEPLIAPTEFGVDLGSANSINGLRALWRGISKSHKAQLEGLRPLITVHERRNGLGLQLRLIAGPLRDAAAAARICAELIDAERDCRTTSFDGQRLALATEPEPKAVPGRSQGKRRSARASRPAAETPPRAAQASSLSNVLGVR